MRSQALGTGLPRRAPLVASATQQVVLAAGDRRYVFDVYGTNDDGYEKLELTEEALTGEKAYIRSRLVPYDRTTVNLDTLTTVLGVLDTIFFAKRYTFRWEGEEYASEEVNYLGVGMGFGHFDVFAFPRTEDAVVEWWNRTKYKHPPTDGEKHWARIGKRDYHRTYGGPTRIFRDIDWSLVDFGQVLVLP